jgi:hypothetical protein
MFKLSTIVLTIVLTIALNLTVGCNKNDQETKEDKTSPVQKNDSAAQTNNPKKTTDNVDDKDPIAGLIAGYDGPPSENPNSFFPMQTGATWTYKITIGEAEPLSYEESRWKLGAGRGSMLKSTRRRYAAMLKAPDKKTFALKMRVKGPAKKQGILEYPIGAEIEILKDELGIFEDVKQMFWAARTNGRFFVHQVITYDASMNSSSSLDSWGRRSDSDGHALSIAFFGATPGTQIGISEKDTLLMKNIAEIPGEKFPILEFIRKVKKGEGDDSILNKNFEERKVFALGKGLILLEQKVEGKPSMTWTLEKFTTK